MILYLLNNDGFEPRKAASTNGGEYGSPCPGCGGQDRFRSWPEKDRYWCRQCGKNGDGVQYLRDFHGLSFKEAADRVGKIIPDRRQKTTSARVRVKPARKKPEPPTADWSTMVGKLVEYAHENLIKNSAKLTWLEDERGLFLETVKRHRLGWVYKDIFDSRSHWGMDEQLNNNGNQRKVLIPSGLVIPCLDMGKVLRVRIRRDKPGKYGKYYVLPGSSSIPMVINDIKPCPESDPIIVVESELDAILFRQEIHNQFIIIALGSAQIKPSDELAEILSHAPFVFVALDSDEAGGKQSVNYWQRRFPNAVRMPIPRQFGKDPCEAHLNGLDLNLWISAAYNLVIDLGGNLNTQTLLQ